MSIAGHLHHIQQRIHHCAKGNKVRLLAVSKTKSISQIIEAYQAGQRAFGENYVQEGIEKIQQLKSSFPDIEWHFIGALQSNKTKYIADYFDWYQTLDRTKIVHRLQEQRSPYQKPLNVLIQVNISQEKSKSGVMATEVMALAEEVMTCDRLALRGLMAIPNPKVAEETQRQAFHQMHTLFKQLKAHFPHAQIDTLSMGMSEDMAMAINEGATMVRVGRAIFGERK